ncbi:MAG: acyl-CoA thioesterase [Ignavibacteriae bacterium]|nr:acyl-CoA thioesterase [Ignavibacteriota bacterium]
MDPRPVAASQVTTTQLVLPNDTNQLGNLLGGTLMHWIDIVAAIAAQRHAGRVCVTASVDELAFHYSVRLGEVVTLEASVNRAFRTSMEIGVRVTAHGNASAPTRHANTAYLTFVAIDEAGHPVPVPPVVPGTPEETRRYEQALSRRENRLARRRTEQE